MADDPIIPVPTCDSGDGRDGPYLWLSSEGLPLDLCKIHAVQAEAAGLDQELATVAAEPEPAHASTAAPSPGERARHRRWL